MNAPDMSGGLLAVFRETGGAGISSGYSDGPEWAGMERQISVDVSARSSGSIRQGGNPRPKRFSVVSYFAGCGGMDLGFQGGFEYKGSKVSRTGLDVIKAYEFNERAIATYRNNISDHIELADLGEMQAADAPAADVLIGGFPCQDFSSCGPKRGLESTRGMLYMSLIHYINEHQPKIVIGENVPNLERMHDGDVMRRIVSDLEATGYKVKVWKLYAPDFGIPQTRTRLFFVCVRPDLVGFPDQPKPEFGFPGIPYRSIEWAIDDLVQVTDETVPNQSQFFLASKAKAGGGQGDETSKRDKPSYTVRANAKSRVQFHYDLPRRLTVRECARLQTFPDDFSFGFAATTNIMQIGNAVPPILANKVARSICKFLRSQP